MKRRALLSSLAALSGAAAGCGATDSGDPGGTTDDTPTTRDRSTTRDRTTTAPTRDQTTTVRPVDTHTVRAEAIQVSGLTGLETRVVVRPDGWLAVLVTCDGRTVTREKRLDDDVHEGLVRAVLDADRASFADSYECTSECPMDVPGTRYVLTVDGTETEVFVDVQADEVPEDLVRIQRELRELRETIGAPTPSCGTTAGVIGETSALSESAATEYQQHSIHTKPTRNL